MSDNNIITVKSGRHPVTSCPVSVEMEKVPANPKLTDENGHDVLCQLHAGRLYWVVDDMPANSEKRYTVGSGARVAGGVEIKEISEDRLEVKIKGGIFTCYHYGKDMPRPFLYPVIGPTGAGVTRSYPMKTDVAGETKDHEHHRSLYVAYGEVNDTDNWSEEQGHGRQVHVKFDEVTSGPVIGRIVATNDWVSGSGVKDLEEQRVFTFYNLPDSERFVDVQVTFTATERDVLFGDTKEGGIISVRVATTMDGDKGGTMVNSIGGVGEAECWGKPAHWVDYYGPVEGKTVGIAIFDHPDSFRYPTRWHVRDYGLFTANPFALKYYEPKKGWNGDYILKKGEKMYFRYRLYIHEGDTQHADVKNRYLNFMFPPQVQLG